MRKISKNALALTLALSAAAAATLLTGCANNPSGSSDAAESETETVANGTDKTITVGASSTPHAEILEQVKDTLAEQGYTLNVVIYDDYILPNQALADGTLDANYFQHTPYLNSFNSSNNTDLVAAASIHYEPFGVYGNEITDLADLAEGATIIIPADDSNETRALFLLAQEGIITLADDADAAVGVSTLDIKDNGGYNVVAVQADTVAAQLKNADAGTIAVINGNYALAAGLSIENALASEDASGTAAQTYANIIAVRSADVDSDKTKALVAALETEEVKQYIADNYNGAVVAIFE